MANTETWLAKAQIGRDALEQSIPRHLIAGISNLPGDDQRNVLHFPEERGVLTPEELDMTSQTVDGLLQRYRTGRWTAEAVTLAFLKRATIGQQLLNFAVEFLADPALEAARSLDEKYRQTGALVGPLHGVPISVKEHIGMKGRICNAGFVCNTDSIPEEDAHIVQLLKKAGAVLHVRTNQPQSIMHLDCNNNITGMTLNPHDRRLSPGGSSGGEGASVAFRCSVLGVGTDIGGSIRGPAAFCSVYGFKPTALRNPGHGLAGIFGGQESVHGCVGPLGQCLGDLIRFQKAVLDQEPWETEPSLMPLGWRDVTLSPPSLTVGIMLDDGLVQPHPPITRALLAAEQKLQAAGIKSVRWQPYQHAEGWDIVKQLYFADGAIRLRSALESSGEPMLPLTEHVLSFASPTDLTVLDNWKLNSRRDKYRMEYQALMKSQGVDVILCPTYVGVGALQGQPKYWAYTAVWNILDYPAVVFPSGLCADKTTDAFNSDYQPRSAEDEREWKAYDPELFDSLPISVQLVGRHCRDEEVLQAAKIVEEAIRKGAKDI
ncbi:amidase [Hirsutella rhossiliensis]|uniref:amidase n=1 Tax=Hirsutella rhossiliensis TaxID=111463 RepID=A0A9P8N8I4_9HYPO|nr:amidase domain-containing protein [Hirsutella rhossiliensis]KAH0966582.1 amidase domain-containing protein [Hirsutella rhossiliensis]